MAGSAVSDEGSGNRAWPAPAKLNLFLHVVGRREDGFHLLQSVFRLIDCCDRVHLLPLKASRVALAQPLDGVDDDQELCVRAARLLQAQTGCRKGVEIRLEKNIPVGGGLGGGSSDAATTLMVLNRLWGLRLDRQRLAKLGLQLGADVPFFLFGRNAFVEGIGERLAPVALPAAWYLVLVPPVTVSTAEIFSLPNLTRNTKSIKISSFSDGFWHNDLESAVCGRYPVVAQHLAWLRAHAEARMSGSGACVFSEFSTEAQARAVASRLPPEMRGFVARGLDHHPLEGSLEEG